MKRKLEISELIFKIFSYMFLTVFALLCLYPFLYAVSASISVYHLFVCHLSIFNIVQLEVFGMSEMLENLSVFVGHCDPH